MRYSLNDKINFGKYKGLAIEQIIDKDPTYVEWLLDNVGNFDLDEEAMDHYWLIMSWEDEEY